MKLTKARLQQIIKEEISSLEEEDGTQASDEYHVSHPYHGKPHRYSPDDRYYKEAVRVLEKVKETYPNLVEMLTEDHFIQNLANDANSAGYGGRRFGYSDAVKVLLEMLEKAHSS